MNRVIIDVGRLLHVDPREVAGDDHHREGLVCHVRSPHGEFPHAKCGFDVAEFDCDFPASRIKAGKLGSLEFVRAGQVGDYHQCGLLTRTIPEATLTLGGIDILEKIGRQNRLKKEGVSIR